MSSPNIQVYGGLLTINGKTNNEDIYNFLANKHGKLVLVYEQWQEEMCTKRYLFPPHEEREPMLSSPKRSITIGRLSKGSVKEQSNGFVLVFPTVGPIYMFVEARNDESYKLEWVRADAEEEEIKIDTFHMQRHNRTIQIVIGLNNINDFLEASVIDLGARIHEIDIILVNKQ